MTIYVIIVTYNGMQWIDRCLSQLRASTISVVPLIIDNCSTDNTLEYIKEHYPEALCLPQQVNLGFGQANNIGINYALTHNADYCLLLNQDAYLATNAIEKMLEVSDGQSLLSPLHLNGNGTKLDAMFRYSIKKVEDRLFDDILIKNSLDKKYEAGEICAACWFIPIAVIKKIGGFNPLFFHYSEDNNYYNRLIFHGIKTILVPHTHVLHDRTLYGNIHVFNKMRLRRDFILIACDINNSILNCIANILKLLIECYFKRLKQHEYRIGAWTIEVLWLIGHIKNINKSRKKEKQPGLTWL